MSRRRRRPSSEVAVPGICQLCGKNPRTPYIGLGPTGKPKTGWKPLCNSCYKRPYRKHKDDHCHICGFVAENQIQLDIDHIDGNHENNDESNLQTLCANCHRLKTFTNGVYGRHRSI